MNRLSDPDCFRREGRVLPDDDEKTRKAERVPKSNGHTRAADKGAGPLGLRITCVGDVETIPVEWQWTGRLACGKLTLLAGDPGIGKSQIATDIAARVSAGLEWPDDGRAIAGNVIILSAEDAVADTIRPRLEATGADVRRIHVINAVIDHGLRERSFNLQEDIEYLQTAVTTLGNVVLIVIDPITSYMGNIDGHRTTDVRAVLEPLARFAQETNIAVLAISHPPKGAQGKAINSVTGSLAYVAAARMVLIAIEEPETERRLLLPVKSNLSAFPAGLAYSLRQTITTKGIVASRVIWDSEPVYTTANEAIRASNAGHTNKVKEAEDFLREKLANGPVNVDQLIDAAKGRDVAEKTLRRASKRLNLVKKKNGYQGKWEWGLPDAGVEDGHQRC